MSKYFAVIEDGIVINTIVSETKVIAETVTQKECVEFTLGSDNVPFIGLGYEDGVFEAPEPPQDDYVIPESPRTP